MKRCEGIFFLNIIKKNSPIERDPFSTNNTLLLMDRLFSFGASASMNEMLFLIKEKNKLHIYFNNASYLCFAKEKNCEFYIFTFY
jgi:hypothetical protein